MNNDAKQIALAKNLLKAGEIVAIPTETVYGLAGDARNGSALEKIFTLKQRPKNHPLIVHIASAGLLPEWAITIPQLAYELCHFFWPGPLTLILKKHPSVLGAVTGDQDTIAIRSPNHPITHALLQDYNGGLCAPSANRFTQLSPTTAEHVQAVFADRIPLILDGGPCTVGIESTILDLSKNKPTILRPGMITANDIESKLGIEIMCRGDNSTTRVPGMHQNHYAPRKPLHLVSGHDLALTLHEYGKQPVFLIALQKLTLNNPHVYHYPMPTNPTGYANMLYQLLHQADNSQANIILVETPPMTEPWFAIHDRLQKACVKK